MAQEYVYVMNGLSKAFSGGKEILKDVCLSFLPGAKIGVLGLNGAGKSTLLKIMAGIDTQFSGEAWAAKGLRIGYLEQEPQLDETLTAGGNVMKAVQPILDLIERFNQVSMRFGEELTDTEMNDLLAEQTELQSRIDAADAWDVERKVDVAMNALRCPPGDEAVAHLSGGEKRRIALCRLLLEQPDILLLDEPTNHLDAESVAWLERYLHEFSGTVVAITHDRYFLDNIAGWILEIDRGRCLPCEGNYSDWLEQRQKRWELESRREVAREKVLKSELEWIRKGAKGRQSKSRARIEAYENLLQEAKNVTPEAGAISIPPAPRLGSLVIELTEVSKNFGEGQLVEKFSFKCPRGAIVGIVGPNGAGKTTLFKMLAGLEQPDSGTIKIGETVQLGYANQVRDSLNAEKTVWQEISDGLDQIDLGTKTMPSRAYVGSFNFKGADQQKKIGDLSGGERNRVHLAKMLRSSANVLLLDEPTNDLDVDTLRSLEEALLKFTGCIFVISHDRWFLDRIATHIIAYEGEGQVTWFEGNYSDYEKDFSRRHGKEIHSTRTKYKKLAKN